MKAGVDVCIRNRGRTLLVEDLLATGREPLEVPGSYKMNPCIT